MSVDLTDTLLAMMHHCNNYFTEDNLLDDKWSPPTLKTPRNFIRLAERIHKFREENKPSAIISESVFGDYQFTKSTTPSGSPATWQQVFAADLAPFKRLRSI